MLLAVTEVVIQVIALVFQCVESFVLDLPASSSTDCQLGNIRCIQLQLRDPTKPLDDLLIGSDFHLLDKRDFQFRMRSVDLQVVEPLGVDCQCLAARFTRNRFDQANLVLLGKVFEQEFMIVGFGT